MRDDMLNRRVQVYWNRTRRRWSVRDKHTRKVIFHAKDCLLMRCKMHVSQAGVRRCRQKAIHEVVAWVEGDLQSIDNYWKPETMSSSWSLFYKAKLKFNVHQMDCFQSSRTHKCVSEAAKVQFTIRKTAWREGGDAWFA